MIDPNFYTTQHIELEVAELDIDEGLKDVILTTLERYEALKAKIAEIEKQEPVKGTYWRDGSGVFTNSPRDTDERLYLRPSLAISKMEATANGLNLRLIEDCLLIYKTQLYSDDWSGLRDKVSEQIDILAKLNKQGA
jgi:hypothetical protein